MSRSRKGDRGERSLVNALDNIGFAVMRAPSSGSATERELPDVLAGNAVNFYAVELKYSSGDPIYLDEEEINGLETFAYAFGATPLIGAKFDVKNGDHAWGVDDDPGFRFWHPKYILTENNAYRVKRERWEDRDVDIRTLKNGYEP